MATPTQLLLPVTDVLTLIGPTLLLLLLPPSPLLMANSPCLMQSLEREEREEREEEEE